MIFETHAHYDDERFDEDRDEVLGSMRNHGVEFIVNIGAEMESCYSTLDLTKKYDFIYGALGIHPDCVYDLTDADYKWIEDHINEDKIVAVGETGLDYYREYDKAVQKDSFERQMDIARRDDKPIIVHSREAAYDTYEIMKANNAEEIGGVVHCFSYPKEMAQKFLDMGFYIGVGGVVTFKNAKKLQEVVSYMPMEQMVLETDCPYLAPDPHRGERNDSRYIHYVADKVAELKGISTEEVINITTANAKKMYKIEG